MDDEEFNDEEDVPGWFEEIVTADGNSWDPDYRDDMIRKRWAQLCAMPSVKRELEVAQTRPSSVEASEE